MPGRLGAVAALLAAAVLATNLAGRASAQSCSGPICSAPAPIGNACRVFLSSADGAGLVPAGQGDEPSGCYDPARAYGLQGWHFFSDEGRRVSRMGIRQTADGLSFSFADADGGEPASGYVWLVPLPEGTEPVAVNASGCAGICRVPLGPMPANATFVLTGFEFERSGADGAIQQLAVGPVLRSATGVGALTVDFRDAEFAYRANVYYALIPSDAVSAPSSTGGDYAGGSAALVGLSDVGDAVLSGFSFKFANGAHTLGDVGLELGGLGYEAWFQDSEDEANRRHPTHPFSWQADYIILN